MSSARPERPRSVKRLSQKRTVAPHRPSLAAIPGALRPSAACCTICARRTSPAPSVRERAMYPSSAASSSPKARTRIVIAMLPHRPAAGLNAPDQEKSQMTSRMHHLVVHPLSYYNIWHGGDPGAARGAVPPFAAPQEGVLVRVPVRGGAPDSLLDLGPGLEAAALQCQRAQDLPPWLDQVQVGGILGLEHELPARVGKREQEDIGGAVDVEIVHHRVDPFDPSVDPALDCAEEIDPVRSGTARVGFGEGLPCGRPEGAEDITFATSAVVDLLLGSLRFGRGRLDHAPAGVAPGRLRSHLVEADDYAARGRGGVEALDRPLLRSNSGSTRAPNQVSSWRHFSPSACRTSLTRLRFMPMPFSPK